MTNQRPESLAPLARSWLRAPGIRVPIGCTTEGYDKGQRAFVFTAEAPTISFSVGASSESPLVNPCFVVKNWRGQAEAGLTINGEGMTPGPDFRQGIVRGTDGTPTLVIWLKWESISPVEFVINGAGGLDYPAD